MSYGVSEVSEEYWDVWGSDGVSRDNESNNRGLVWKVSPG